MEIYTSCRFTNCAAHLPDSRFPSPGQRTAISDNCYFKVVSNAVQARRADGNNAGWVGGNKKSCRSTNCAAHLPDSRFPSPGQRTAISDNCYFKVVSPSVQARRANAGWVGGNKKIVPLHELCGTPPRLPFPVSRTTYSHLGQLRTAISDNCYFKVVSNAVQARRADGNIYSVPLYELCGTPTRFPFPVSRTTYSHLGQLLFQSCFKCSLYTITACLLKIFSSYVMIIKITTK